MIIRTYLNGEQGATHCPFLPTLNTKFGWQDPIQLIICSLQGKKVFEQMTTLKIRPVILECCQWIQDSKRETTINENKCMLITHNAITLSHNERKNNMKLCWWRELTKNSQRQDLPYQEWAYHMLQHLLFHTIKLEVDYNSYYCKRETMEYIQLRKKTNKNQAKWRSESSA